MLVEAFCKKCQNKFMIDIGDSTKEEIIALLEKQEGFHCDAGNHMEMSSPLNYWEIDWDTIKDGASLTDEEFVEEFKKTYPIVLSHSDFPKVFENVGFAYGSCIANVIGDPNETPIMLNFIHTPKERTRYYYTDTVNQDILHFYNVALEELKNAKEVDEG